jgi:manganese/zinc/iron transport system permease protein
MVLRGMSMFGDAISHAVLPGIVIAYLISGSKGGVPLLIGAAFAGMFVTILIGWLQKRLRIQNDAAIGLSYTFLFAVGIILVSLFSSQTDLDQECVLYGEIAYAPFDTWLLDSGISLGPRQLWISGGLTLLMLCVLILAYRPLFVSSFDPEFAAAAGYKVNFWHFILLGMISLSTVISFEAVGSILVIALLTGPAVTAMLLPVRLPYVFLFAALFGISGSILGYLLATVLNASVSGSIAVMIGIQFGLVLFSKEILKRFRFKQMDDKLSGIN